METTLDRRHFLILAGRAGLAAGAGVLLDACGQALSPTIIAQRPPPSVVPPGASAPSPAASPSSSAPPILRLDHAIAAENRRPGDGGWDVREAPEAAESWVFAREASVLAGETVQLQVASPGRVDVGVYRLGWYGGLGGRLVHSERDVEVSPAGLTAVDPVTGLAEATGGTTVAIPTDREWTSGIHVVVIRPAARGVRHRPASPLRSATTFTIRTPAPAPVLFVSAAATWQAYNGWGGADLYGTSIANEPRITDGVRAVAVSFDRPYRQSRGLGLMPRWEVDFVRWQEREGRNVDYCVDIDLELHPEVVRGRRLILFVGHHEYWSRPMRATLETAIASSTNVAFLSADEMAWQIRLEPSPVGPGRRVICYKSAALDPDASTSPPTATCRWREPPVLDPEAVVIGQMYGHIVERVADWVVAGSGHWLYEGTRLRDGDRLTNLVGQEYDTFFPRLAPPGTILLARSPVVPVRRGGPEEPPPMDLVPMDPNLHTATVYEAESGATVIAAGTFQWAWALDGWGDRSYRGAVTPIDERVARMTRNLFDRLGDGPGAV